MKLKISLPDVNDIKILNLCGNYLKNKMNEKIASDFFPTISASKLGPLCGNPSESTRFRYLKNYKPYSDLLVKSSRKDEIFKLSPSEKGIVKKYLEENINLETLKFNDQLVLESFQKEHLPLINQEFMQKSFLTKEDISDDFTIEEYFTAESDEEKFIITNDNTRQEQEKLKSLNAIRYISTSRGNRLEKSIMDKINEETKMNFIKNKARKFKKFSMFEIVGIIDGICSEEKCILEIKTRKRFDKFKETISKSEKIQALVYMNLHESDKCLFVECGSNGELKKTIIDYDDFKFQNEIVKSLEQFCNFARDLTKEDFENLVQKYFY